MTAAALRLGQLSSSSSAAITAQQHQQHQQHQQLSYYSSAAPAAQQFAAIPAQTALQPCSRATVQPCSHAALQSCSCAAVQHQSAAWQPQATAPAAPGDCPAALQPYNLVIPMKSLRTSSAAQPPTESPNCQIPSRKEAVQLQAHVVCE